MYTIWRFDGSGGCEDCGAMTGDYSYDPGRPHPNCNCSCTEVTIDEVCEVIDQSTIEMVLDSWTNDLGPGRHHNTRIYEICEGVLISTDKHLHCCKVENNEVTDICYETDRTDEDYDSRCGEPVEGLVA